MSERAKNENSQAIDRGDDRADPPTMPADDALWYKDAIVYELHVKAFQDANADGVGDFRGLTDRLDYLHDLGVNTLWLLPFYPSPMKDDGYDVSDYHNIDPRYGTRNDFRQFVREAHRRGLRVITELVVNHTSDQHPWFQAARRSPPGSAKRGYYVWSDDPNKYSGTRIIFTDTESSNWAWDDIARSHYWHRFFSHQPDLNFDNPHVLKAIFRTMRFWLDMGVDGFRLDAIPYLVEREGTNNENLPETHGVIKRIRALLDQHYRNRMLLAEANQWPEDVREYFGEGDECHMAYHFPLMPRLFMAIAQEDRYPVVEIMKQTPEIPESCQWAIFLRNHDELTLEMVTDRERDYMYKAFASDPRMRINVGIRRRLAPLMENDRERIELMSFLLMTMPGSPILYYGDEIGMGDNVFLGDRNGVRTPMQWSPDRNAGFSRADPQRLYLPPIMDPVYGYEAVNVEAQTRNSSSLLNWTRRLIAVRKAYRAFGRGRLVFLSPGNRKILAYLRQYGDEDILCVANMARYPQAVELDLSKFEGRVPVEIMGRVSFPPIGKLPYLLTLPGRGYYAFKLAQDAPPPEWHEEHLGREDLPVLVLFDGWRSFFRDRVVPWRIGMAEKLRAQFEQDVLPRFAMTQRWYAAKGVTLRRMALQDHLEWPGGGGVTTLFALFRGEAADREAENYFVPLALAWEDGSEEVVRHLLPATIARIRQQARVGVLADATADDAFVHSLVTAIAERREVPTAVGSLRFVPTSAFAELAGDAPSLLPVQRPGAQSSNTVAVLGERLFLKVYRRLQTGINPEIEIGRFLTEVVRFPNVVPLAGAVEYADHDGALSTLAILQAHTANQGDAWTYTLGYLERFLEAQRTERREGETAAEVHAAFLELMSTLARRTAELHLALATPTGDPAFDPEPISADDLATWSQAARMQTEDAIDHLARRGPALPDAAHADARMLLSRRRELVHRIESMAPKEFAGVKIRHHGDYHLGQVLVRNNDFVIIDFEGEPARPLAERRRKHSPIRDVAGMLRSFDYAQRAALDHVVGSGPEGAETLEPAALAWLAETRRVFLDTYRDVIRDSALAPDWDGAMKLLDTLLIEKAVYELRYELDHRPDWAGVPLRGLVKSLGPAA